MALWVGAGGRRLTFGLRGKVTQPSRGYDESIMIVHKRRKSQSLLIYIKMRY